MPSPRADRLRPSASRACSVRRPSPSHPLSATATLEIISPTALDSVHRLPLLRYRSQLLLPSIPHDLLHRRRHQPHQPPICQPPSLPAGLLLLAQLAQKLGKAPLDPGLGHEERKHLAHDRELAQVDRCGLLGTAKRGSGGSATVGEVARSTGPVEVGGSRVVLGTLGVGHGGHDGLVTFCLAQLSGEPGRLAS